MNKWLIAVETNCTDPSREEEFNDWYDNTHIPDVLKVPGIVRMARYENVTPGEQTGKYLALLEVEAEDIWEVTTALTHNRDRAEKEGRMTPLLEMTNGTIYRRITDPQESR